MTCHCMHRPKVIANMPLTFWTNIPNNLICRHQAMDFRYWKLKRTLMTFPWQTARVKQYQRKRAQLTISIRNRIIIITIKKAHHTACGHQMNRSCGGVPKPLTMTQNRHHHRRLVKKPAVLLVLANQVSHYKHWNVIFVHSKLCNPFIDIATTET